MSQNIPPPIPSLVPETAPFTPDQRNWLNGFFAGLVSLDTTGITPLSGEQSAALMQGGMPGTKASATPASISRIAGATCRRRATSAVADSTASRIRKI